MKSPAKVLSSAVGGLTEIGMSRQAPVILVVSHSGRAILDLDSGQRLARDYEAPTLNSDWIREADRTVRGIGPIADEWVHCVGLWGGLLLATSGPVRVDLTEDGDPSVVLSHGSDSLVLDQPMTEVHALGFEPSGRYLILATSSDLCIWDLEEPPETK